MDSSHSMHKNILIIFLGIFSTTAIATDIDVGYVFGSAFIIVIAKFVFAAAVFYIFSLGLISSPKDTAVKNGRWVGAFVASVFVFSMPTLHKSYIDLYVGGAILTIVWFALGFLVGYIWHRVKAHRASNSKITFKNKNIKLIIIILVLVGAGLLYNNRKITYDVYPSCKSVDKDCNKIAMQATFDVQKETSQVILIGKFPGYAETRLIKLANCVVLDKHNWQCKGDSDDEPSNDNYLGGGNWIRTQPYIYKMTDDNITMSDSYITSHILNKIEITNLYGWTFVRN